MVPNNLPRLFVRVGCFIAVTSSQAIVHIMASWLESPPSSNESFSVAGDGELIGDLDLLPELRSDFDNWPPPGSFEIISGKSDPLDQPYGTQPVSLPVRLLSQLVLPQKSLKMFGNSG